jgi:hypothetical protein
MARVRGVVIKHLSTRPLPLLFGSLTFRSEKEFGVKKGTEEERDREGGEGGGLENKKLSGK